MGNNWINGVDPDGGCFTTDADGNTIPCPDMALGSTMVGVAGYEWTMQSDGWDRSDGYGVFLNYSKSIGAVVPDKINFATMNNNQIVSLAIDWYALMEKN